MNQNEAAKAEGNDTAESLNLLRRLKTEVFESSDVHVALAMGRPVEEIEAWFSGAEEIDEDAEMKIHGIAKERLGE
jgi:hypothetical protein